MRILNHLAHGNRRVHLAMSGFRAITNDGNPLELALRQKMNLPKLLSTRLVRQVSLWPCQLKRPLETKYSQLESLVPILKSILSTNIIITMRPTKRAMYSEIIITFSLFNPLQMVQLTNLD